MSIYSQTNHTHRLRAQLPQNLVPHHQEQKLVQLQQSSKVHNVQRYYAELAGFQPMDKRYRIRPRIQKAK